MQRETRAILRGIKTYIPGLSPFKKKGGGNTHSARYCYAVWLRHLLSVSQYGLTIPSGVIAEIGPGKSLGIGLAGLLCGARKYYALDVVDRSSDRQHLEIFDALVSLFKKREDIPGEDEFSKVYPRLNSYSFPSHILTEERLDAALDAQRVQLLREQLLHLASTPREQSLIQYICPWSDQNVVQPESVDFLYSQAVLEHVDELDKAYQAMLYWLKPGGIMSHQIGFQSHGLSDTWNGHWTFSDFSWKLVRGKRAYLLNREPLSTHLALLKKYGFKLITVLPVTENHGVRREQLSRRFQNLSAEDFRTIRAYVVAQKN